MARNDVAPPFVYTRETRNLTDGDFSRLVRALLLFSETGNATVEPYGGYKAPRKT